MKNKTFLIFLTCFLVNYTFAQSVEKADADSEKQLVKILDNIFHDDQDARQQINDIGKEHGWESKELKKHLKLIKAQDSINIIKIKKILDEHGWLGADVIGNQGSSTLFLVIQHSDLETQNKYLPMMREAVIKGNAKGSDLAFLEDRVALRKGDKQIYGTQIAPDPETGKYIVLPLFDPENVDERRAKAGLGTMQNYISGFGVTWDGEEYKKELPELEKRYRNYMKSKQKNN